MSDSTAVTTTKKATLTPEAEARIAENRARNAMATAIRGTIWSKDLSAEGVRAVAEYCRQNDLDPIRHVEVLGGKIYLTAELYRERAAPLIQRGIIVPMEPDFINADARLDQLADAGDEWAQQERTRRLRERIKHNVPEKAQAACVMRLQVAATGRTVVGVNWCGGGVRQRDPVGDSEPTKTAQTRAERRAWRAVAEAVPTFGQQFAVMHHAAEVTGEIIVQDAIAEAATRPRLHGGATVGASVTADPYGHGDEMPSNEESLARVRKHIEQHGLPDPYGVGEAA